MIYLKKNGSLLDVPITELEDRLSSSLPWIDNIFGKCERIVRKAPDGAKIQYPAWYVSGNDYIYIIPDDNTLGNHCFFVADDPLSVTEGGRYRCGLSIVFWGDCRKVAPERDIEAVKSEILFSLRQAVIPHGRFVVEKVYERAENVYSGFTLPETPNQYMMHPYFAIRVYGSLYMNEVCYF